MPVSAKVAYRQGVTEPARITAGITNRQMSVLLKEAAQEAEQLILRLMQSSSFSSQVRLAQMAAIRSGIAPISTQLWSQVGRLTEVGMFAQAELAAEQALIRDALIGMPDLAVQQYASVMHVEARAGIQSVLSRRTNGYTLADRIYRNGAATTRAVGRIVDKALIQQLSAKELARQVRGFYSPNVPGGASYASKRLARTEINNAHHHTTIRMSEMRPWVTGYEWNLSKSHPKPDPCDELADSDDYGLGPGKYTKGNAPDRPHPQCLCYLTHVQEEDDVFIDKLASGSYDSWLRRKGL